MKTSSASVLAAISLSLALCACDNGGDKKEGAAPPVPKKAPKEPAASGNADKPANPQPPEPGDAPKAMSATPEGMEVPASADEKRSVDMLNMALAQYAQKQMTKGMGASGRPGGGGASTSLTSLDQLVKAGVLKAIPEAPAGKKFVLDVATQKVKLAPK